MDKTAANAAIQKLGMRRNPSSTSCTESFAKLSAELSPAGGSGERRPDLRVLPLTYGVYLKMYPELTEEQKTQIKTG